MRLKKVKLANFRSYKDEISIDFNSLDVFVGKNDIGKSTVLEALDIFFNENKGIIKIDKDDINKEALQDGNNEIRISVTLDELPETLTIDSTNPTTLSEEHLLLEDGTLEIVKLYPNAGKEKVFIKCYHPTNELCNDLHLKKIGDLRKVISSEDITCSDQSKKADLRKSIWENYSSDLQLNEVELDISKFDEKDIWDGIKNYLPMYSLFQSDRKNSDGDSEIQDPMQLAVKEILDDQELKDKLNEVARSVKEKLNNVATHTLNKINEMNPEIANDLKPIIPNPNNLKWHDVFKKVSISGDEEIPINKRGSGVKRLILLNFFRAEAERRQGAQNIRDIIYAIEEPETSQHPNHQKKLIEAFIELSRSDNTQIVMTTHSPEIVKLLKFENIKLIKDEESKEVVNVERRDLPYPSLNEVNYLAFNEANDEYHNELYGFIESEGLKNEFVLNKPLVQYNQLDNRDGSIRERRIILSEYIRHQIHHPENPENSRFSNEQLQQSISEMRSFISNRST